MNNFALKFLSDFSVDAPKLILFECPLYYYRYKEQESLKPEFSKAEQLKEALENGQAVKKKLEESTKQLQNVENTHERYINPSNAEATFVQRKRMQRLLKTI